MTIFSLVASHKTVDLSTVAHLASGATLLKANELEIEIRGLVVLSTCNRLEIYGETAHDTSSPQQAELDVAETASALFEELSALSGLALEVVESSFDILIQEDVAQHLFTVASGLESAVVGEREIAGQVRRALSGAQIEGNASGNLVRLFDSASQTARRVGQQTLLGSRGRSVVSVGLDLANDVAEKSWESRQALVFGTGAYAGATVAALRERGCTDITVYSASNRAATFADKRSVKSVELSELSEALRKADLVIGCSGSSDPLPASVIPAGKRVFIDLALSRDFAPDVADLPDVELITLESVRLAAPEETDSSMQLAHTIVDNAVEEFSTKEKARTVDAAIVALREHTMSILDSELEKVRSHFGCGGAAEQVEFAMRRMVKSLLHIPTVRAKALAKEGREADYIVALEALYGIEVEHKDKNVASFPQADAS